MTTTTFDTLAYAKKLRDAGIPELQAEAQAAALVDVLKDTSGGLATKTDLDRLEERTEARFRLLQWMVGFNLAVTVAILWLLIKH
jgi:hypothetical protein